MVEENRQLAGDGHHERPNAPLWAKRLALARTQAGLTQAQLAKKLHVSQSAVTDWERGRTRPRIHLWKTLGSILGVAPSIFMREGETEPSEYSKMDTSERRQLFIDFYNGIQSILQEAGATWEPAALAYYVHARINGISSGAQKHESELPWVSTPADEVRSMLSKFREQMIPGETAYETSELPQTG